MIMRAGRAKQRPVAALGIAAMIIAAMPAPGAAGEGFLEAFEDNPLTSGRFTVHDGDAGRFNYLPEVPALRVHYDTGLPTARLVRPLCRTLTERDSFRLRIRFRINSGGFFAHAQRHAQIAFGLMNAASTGTDRVYGTTGGGAYDLVSLDYYPNITLFGGPSLGATILNRDTGAGFVAALNFPFGPESEMNDPGEGPLPLDTELQAELLYDGVSRVSTVRLWQGITTLPVNAYGDGFAPGGFDGDAATIQTAQAGAGFSVDRFAFLLWRDYSAAVSTVIADVDFLAVQLSWQASADADLDGDVDADDFGHFQACNTGPAIPQPDEDCRWADLDCDGDVDQEDFGRLQVQFTEEP
ncbi:MAG: hypothetical protein AMXMBFR13_32520 [Phycisphaerae bacterium]